MKTVFILICFLVTTIVVSQNNPPIAINDTIEVDYNDTISFSHFSGNQTNSQPAFYGFLQNDTDVDRDYIFIDTIYYSNTGYLSINTIPLQQNPPSFISWVYYSPPHNFYGYDMFTYRIRDSGSPTKYALGNVYVKVRRAPYQLLNVNNISTKVSYDLLFSTLFASIGKQSYANGAIPGFESPKGNKTHTISSSQLWIAGKNNDSIYSSANTYETFSEKTIGHAGPIMNPLFYPKNYDFKWDRVWDINSWDINYHINNWSNSGYQAPEVIENWPAHGDTTKGQAYYLAPFLDNNNDGIYNPYDGDYPKIKGQQAIYFIYNSERDRISNYSNEFMKVEVHGMAYSYNCSIDSALNNTVFVDYKIYNRSNLSFDSTYVGVIAQLKIGELIDDYMGSDVMRNSVYGYNADGIDNDNPNYSTYNPYLDTPPAQSITLLKGVEMDSDGIDNSYGIGNDESVNGFGFGDGIIDNEIWGMEYATQYHPYWSCFGSSSYATTAKEFYAILKGLWPANGSSIVYGGNGNANSTGGTIPAKFLYPDTSDIYAYGIGGLTQPPWSEISANNPPNERRPLISTGPFTFMPDSSVEITLAFVFGRDYQNTGNMAGVVVMQERIDSIRSYYLNDFTNTACGLALNVDKKAENDNLLQVYPNPFNQQITINYELETLQAKLHIYNVFGKLIQQQLITKNQTTIDLSQQAKGIYFIRLIDGKTNITKKVMKQ